MPNDERKPFDEIRDLVARMPGPDADAAAAVRAREATLTKPAGALGRMETIVEWLASWQGKAPPTVDRPLCAVFAGNHGVAARGVSAYPTSVTRQMVENFAAGGAAINQICLAHGLGLRVYDLALDVPTRDIAEAPALDERECVETIVFGMEAAAGADLLCIGEMGIGNTTVAAAVACGLFGGDPAEWVGRGTGVDEAGLERKREAVAAAVTLHGEAAADPLEVLRRLGGRELAAMAGAIIAARHARVPVILDGFVATAAAAALHALDGRALDHCLAGHCSAEAGHRKLLEHIGKVPLLDLGLRLGEGSGAALAAGLVKTAAAVHSGMATFEQAGISRKS